MPSASELMALGQYAGGPQPGRAQQLIEILAQTWPARAAQEALGFAAHPGEVYAGRADAGDVGKAIGMAGLAMTGGVGGAPAGAIGSGPVRQWAKPKGHDSYETVPVDVAKVEAAWKREPDMYIGPGGEGQIRKRYPQFGEWLTANPDTAVEMPLMALGPNDIARFSNGRHRFAYMRDQGVNEMPVMIPAEDAAMFRRLYGTGQ